MEKKKSSKKKAVHQNQSDITPVPAIEAKKVAARVPYVPVARLRKLAGSFIGLARQNATAFAKCGFPAERIDQLQATLDAFDQGTIAYGAFRAATMAATTAVHTAVEGSLDLRTQVIAALKIVFQGDPDSLRELRSLGSGRSPGALANWLIAVQPMMSKVHADLKPYFQVDPLELVQVQEAALTKTVAEQGTLRRNAGASKATRDGLRSQLIAELDQVKLVAAIAFPRDRTMLKAFDKGFETRRKSAAGSTTTEPSPAPAPAAPLPAAGPVAAAPVSTAGAPALVPAPVAPSHGEAGAAVKS